MKIDCYDCESRARIGLRVPAVMKFIEPGSLRATVDQKRDRIFAAGLEAYGLHHIAVHGLAVPAFETECFEIAERDVVQARGVHLRHTPLDAVLQDEDCLLYT